MTGSGQLTGVLKGNTAGAPTAMTGTADYNTYWSDANTIAAEQYTSIARGGTGANISGPATGSLIYKDAAGTMTGTGQLTGVLKGNGAGAPTGDATVADLAETATYKWYDPTNVTITGGSVGGTTILGSYNRTIAELRAITPTAKGEVYFCTNCSPPKVVVSTGTAQREFADALGGQFQ
jgi:hypothetical protein